MNLNSWRPVELMPVIAKCVCGVGFLVFLGVGATRTFYAALPHLIQRKFQLQAAPSNRFCGTETFENPAVIVLLSKDNTRRHFPHKSSTLDLALALTLVDLNSPQTEG